MQFKNHMIPGPHPQPQLQPQLQPLSTSQLSQLEFNRKGRKSQMEILNATEAFKKPDGEASTGYQRLAVILRLKLDFGKAY